MCLRVFGSPLRVSKTRSAPRDTEMTSTELAEHVIHKLYAREILAEGAAAIRRLAWVFERPSRRVGKGTVTTKVRAIAEQF